MYINPFQISKTVYEEQQPPSSLFSFSSAYDCNHQRSFLFQKQNSYMHYVDVVLGVEQLAEFSLELSWVNIWISFF